MLFRDPGWKGEKKKDILVFFRLFFFCFLFFLFFVDEKMNPLCCIAPVSIDRDRANPTVVKSQNDGLGIENAVTVRPVNFNSRQSFSNARISSVNGDSESTAKNNNGSFDNCNGNGGLAEENAGEGKETTTRVVYSGNVSVAGVLYKWVNYGKGWRARWFVLEDGVLSYYKVHGPDRIVMSPGGEKGLKVIGEDSWRYLRKASNIGSNHHRLNGSIKQWKPFGEVHLKVRPENPV